MNTRMLIPNDTPKSRKWIRLVIVFIVVISFPLVMGYLRGNQGSRINVGDSGPYTNAEQSYSIIVPTDWGVVDKDSVASTMQALQNSKDLTEAQRQVMMAIRDAQFTAIVNKKDSKTNELKTLIMVMTQENGATLTQEELMQRGAYALASYPQVYEQWETTVPPKPNFLVPSAVEIGGEFMSNGAPCVLRAILLSGEGKTCVLGLTCDVGSLEANLPALYALARSFVFLLRSKATLEDRHSLPIAIPHLRAEKLGNGRASPLFAAACMVYCWQIVLFENSTTDKGACFRV